jgi:hypothetical protein
MDCKIITIEVEEKVFWWGILIVLNVLMDKPTLCQSVRRGRLYSYDSKAKVS